MRLGKLAAIKKTRDNNSLSKFLEPILLFLFRERISFYFIKRSQVRQRKVPLYVNFINLFVEKFSTRYGSHVMALFKMDTLAPFFHLISKVKRSIPKDIKKKYSES